MSDDYSPEGGDTGLIEAKVKWYNGRKGFGFVLGPDGQDVFFHASALTEAGIDQPDTDDILVCEIGSDRQGRRLVTRITELKRGPGGGGGARGGFGDRPPRRDFGAPGGGGGFGDRPPRRDFGAPGGFGDRPPRRDFGAPGGFGDRPPRRDFGGPPGGGFGAPRGPGGFGGGGDRGPRRNFDEGTGPVYPLNGTVKWFDQVRGFGFVTPEDGGQDVFLHSSVLTRAGRTDLQQGEKVSLDVRDGQRGRQAVGMK